MSRRPPDPVVHLELHTPNLPRACGFYGELLGWSTDVVRVASGAYVGLGLGERVDGGIVESEREPPRWIPYVETAGIGGGAPTGRAARRAVGRPDPRGRRGVVVHDPRAGGVDGCDLGAEAEPALTVTVRNNHCVPAFRRLAVSAPYRGVLRM